MLEENKGKEDKILENVPVFIGIDVSKARLDIRVRPLAKGESFSNDEVGIRTLVKGCVNFSPR